jgi:hypothetical protein
MFVFIFKTGVSLLVIFNANQISKTFIAQELQPC